MMGVVQMFLEPYDLTLKEVNDFFLCSILVIKDSKIVSCNDKAIEAFGYTKKDLLGKSPINLSPIEQPDGLPSREKWEKVLLDGTGTRKSFQWLHTRKDGQLFLSECRIIKKGDLLFYLVSDIDENEKLK